MKISPVKQALFNTLLIFSTGCFFVACSKTGIKPKNGFVNSTKGSHDSTLAADTLPSFFSPTGIAVDATGTLYVADYGNNMIRKITPNGTVSTLAGSGTEGSTNAMGVLATFSQPSGIAVDGTGNLYVADAGDNQVRKITPAGLVTTLAGSDSTGSVNGAGAKATFFAPSGVTVDGAGNIYVADAGNNLIRKITTDGTVTTLAGSLTTGTATTTIFNNPTGLAADASGNIFVANYLSNTILQVTQTGTISTFAGSGQSGNINGSAATASFFFPKSVAVGTDHTVYVADGVNNLIRKIAPDGTVSTLAGSGAAGAVDGTGSSTDFNGPAGLTVDAAGNVYVADTNNNLIRKITPAGVVTTIAGNGKAGAKNGKVAVGRGSIRIAALRNKLL